MLRVVFKNLNKLNMLWPTIADRLHATYNYNEDMLCARVSVTLIVKSVTSMFTRVPLSHKHYVYDCVVVD